MAVAVKNREATSTGVLERLPVQIVLGVVYVIAALVVAFPLPYILWWRVLGLDAGVVGWWVLLIVVQLGLAGALAVGGARLLGPHPQKGLKVGILLGFVGVFLIALLGHWLGLLIENYLYHSQYLGDMSRVVGVAVTVGLGVLILVLGASYFLSPKAEPYLKALAEQGWLTSAPYKRSQGQRVRRGTILGVLVLAGAGIWALERNLEKYGGDWAVSVPFTGKVLITANNVGDNPTLQGELKQEQDKLTDEWKGRRSRALETLQTLGPRAPSDLQDKLNDLAAADAEVKQALPAYQGQPQPLSGEEVAALQDALKTLWQPEPQASIEMDRFQLRAVNEQFNTEYRKILDPGDDPYGGPEAVEFSPGQIVRLSEVDAERHRRENERNQLLEERDKFKTTKDPELIRLPTDGKVAEADGPPRYFSLVLLPKVAYTIPLILSALTLWLGWRLVNVPVFADFLIATEAELNKVSWTTRRRLVQDTIVVLTTVVLMAVFLFVADFLWSKVLTQIGVLQPPAASGPPAEPKW
jgi:preprotein translocase SecE subunit